MTATDLSAAAGVLISLVLSYTPGLREKWAAQTAEFKSLCMFASLALISIGLFAGSCADLWFAATCDRDGALNLLRVFVAALVANQGAYLISPPVPSVKHIKLKREVKEERAAVAKKIALLFLPLPFMFAATVGVASADADSSPSLADTFPHDETYCLAAAIHTEAARQSPEAKAAIARWILVRAIEREQTVCQSLRSERTVLAAHALPGTWAWYVFHHGDLLQRKRGAESWLIAMHVYDSAGVGEQFAHFDSCDTDAGWAQKYERVRLVADDGVCFWR